MRYIGFIVILLPTIILTMLQFKQLRRVNEAVIRLLRFAFTAAIIIGILYIIGTAIYHMIVLQNTGWDEVIQKAIIVFIASFICGFINRELGKIEQEGWFGDERGKQNG